MTNTRTVIEVPHGYYILIYTMYIPDFQAPIIPVYYRLTIFLAFFIVTVRKLEILSF